MPVKERNFSLLKRCGYETVFIVYEHSVLIKCISMEGKPNLEMDFRCKKADWVMGKVLVGTCYEIEHAQFKDLSNGLVKEFEAKGAIYIHEENDKSYLLAGKRIMDEVLSCVDKENVFEYLWILAKEMLKSRNESIRSSLALTLLKGVPNLRIEKGKIIHPLILNKPFGKVSFVSRSFLEYSLCRELNKMDPSTLFELRTYISHLSLDYLEYSDDLKKVNERVVTLKNQAIQKQHYETAATLRDLEKQFQVDYLKRNWPSFSESGANNLLDHMLKDMGIEV